MERSVKPQNVKELKYEKKTTQNDCCLTFGLFPLLLCMLALTLPIILRMEIIINTSYIFSINIHQPLAFFLQVHIKSHFIMNGVCVKFRGWLDLERLDGAGCLEYDEKRAFHEDAILRDQIDRYNQRLRDFEDKQRQYRGDRPEDMEAVRRGGIGVGVGGGMWRR